MLLSGIIEAGGTRAAYPPDTLLAPALFPTTFYPVFWTRELAPIIADLPAPDAPPRGMFDGLTYIPPIFERIGPLAYGLGYTGATGLRLF